MQSIRKLFHGLGKIKKIKVYRSEINHYESNGSALVVFSGVVAAKAALSDRYQGVEITPGNAIKITEANFGHKTIIAGMSVSVPTPEATLAAQLAASISSGGVNVVQPAALSE